MCIINDLKQHIFGPYDMQSGMAHGSETDFDQVPWLWQNKPVQFECSEPGELVKMYLIEVAKMLNSTTVILIIFLKSEQHILRNAMSASA